MKLMRSPVKTLGFNVAPAPTNSWRRPDASANDRGYTYAWQQARLRFLKRRPLCVMCERDGRTTLATVVDHKVPHRGDMTLFWDQANWQPLCKTHHDGEKQRQEHGLGSQLP